MRAVDIENINTNNQTDWQTTVTHHAYEIPEPKYTQPWSRQF